MKNDSYVCGLHFSVRHLTLETSSDFPDFFLVFLSSHRSCSTCWTGLGVSLHSGCLWSLACSRPGWKNSNAPARDFALLCLDSFAGDKRVSDWDWGWPHGGPHGMAMGSSRSMEVLCFGTGAAMSTARIEFPLETMNHRKPYLTI